MKHPIFRGCASADGFKTIREMAVGREAKILRNFGTAEISIDKHTLRCLYFFVPDIFRHTHACFFLEKLAKIGSVKL